MILKREGAGEFRELTTQERQVLLKRILGKTEDELKRNLEFQIKGKRGMVNGRVEMTYPTSKSLLHTFTCRENGTTVEYAYCHRVENVRDGGVVLQKLMSANGEPWPQKLGLQFRRTKKKIICTPQEIDRALYLLMYPECDASPYRGNNPHTYEYVRKEEKAKESMKVAKEKVALQHQILNEMDITTLRAYVAATGNKEVHLMDEDEIRSVVYHDAVKDPEKFKMRINSSSMTLRADVTSFVQDSFITIKQFQNERFWQISKGQLKGELLAKIPSATTDEIKSLMSYFFDNPREFDSIKHEYLKLSGTKPVAKEVTTLAENNALTRVEKYAEEKLIMYFPAKRVVLLSDPQTGKKRSGSAELCVVQPGQDWKTALALAIESDPTLEQLIEL